MDKSFLVLFFKKELLFEKRSKNFYPFVLTRPSSIRTGGGADAGGWRSGYSG
jgi:hypothetical protein